jgi:trans-aconitate 2-methyltransferase
MTNDAWDPAQYNRFAEERAQPFWDLLDLVRPSKPGSVVDLGCGDGRLTAELHRHVKAGETVGVDSSPSMLTVAAQHAGHGLSFREGDLDTWCEPDRYDLVFANASLQWSADHPDLLERLTRSLRPGGQLAIQVPANADQIPHLLAGEVASELMDDPPPDPVAVNVLLPEQYAVLLDQLGYAEQQVRLQVYPHHLASTEQIVEWVKGTTLSRFKEPLGAERWNELVALYQSRLIDTIGDQRPVFFPFKRILAWARLV